MAGFDPILLGTTANDRTGDTFRAGGTKINTMLEELFNITATKRVIINSLSDFPTPAASVITLLADTQYLLANDVNLGANRIVLASKTTVSGIESILITLSYTGTGDMFTILNTSNRINNLGISCVSGRVLNLSDNADSVFRMNDCSVSCDRFAILNSTGASGTSARFTTVSPSAVTTSGITFTGGFNTLLWEVSTINMSAGIAFNLGTATFDAFITDTILTNLSGGTTFLSGAASSANINVGGLGQVKTTLSTGAGTLLSGITTSDSRWEFLHNDDIMDTRPDSLISMQGNSTDTVISGSGTYVLVAGTWVVDTTSQFTSTTAGRATYTAGKDARLPVTFSCSVEPTSGANKLISVKVAMNGTVVDNSKRTALVSSGDPTSITMPWQETFSTNDYVEVFVTNDTDTVDILVSSAIGRIN